MTVCQNWKMRWMEVDMQPLDENSKGCKLAPENEYLLFLRLV